MHNIQTLLILGAGVDQKYPIMVAHEMGLRVLVADINPSAPSFNYADEAAVVSNRDLNGLKQICDDSLRRGFKISGVLVMGTDIPDIAAELSIYLNVPGPSIDTGKWATDKYLMKQRLSEAGIPVPWFEKVLNLSHLKELMEQEGGGKFVIKPTNRSGARGVALIDKSLENLAEIYAETLSEAGSGEVQIERYIKGQQISTESIIWNGKAYTPGFVDRNYEMLERFAPNFIENGGVHPSIFQGKKRASIEELVERAANALGIVSGVAKGDVVVDENGTPMIIEMAARLSGGDFSESLIPIGTGVNIVKEAINIAIGNNINVNNLKEKWTVITANRYFFGTPGTLNSIKGLDKVLDFTWLKKIDIYVVPGDVINPVKFHANRLGVFIVEANDHAELDERIKLVYKLIDFDISPHVDYF